MLTVVVQPRRIAAAEVDEAFINLQPGFDPSRPSRVSRERSAQAAGHQAPVDAAQQQEAVGVELQLGLRGLAKLCVALPASRGRRRRRGN